MTKKDKNFLIFASLGALSLSILTIASNEGKGFLADLTQTYSNSCYEIVFGGTFSTSSGTVGTNVCYSTTMNVSAFSSAYCYKSDASANTTAGKALKCGTTTTGNTGTFTFTFGQSYIITAAKIYANAYSSSQGSATVSVTTTAQTTAVTNMVSYNSVSSVDVGYLDADTTATSACAYVFSGLDGGNKTASTSFTLTSQDKKAPYIAKIVFTVAVATAPAEKSLSNISVTTQPTTKSYIVGDALDTTGLVVTANYSDSTSADVTSSCTLSPTNGSTLSTAGTQTVNVSYTYSGVTKTASFDVTVSSSSTVTLSSIAVTAQPTKVSYTVGETLDTTGMQVTATYSDGSTAVVTGWSVSSPDMSTVGTKEVTVNYNGKTDTFNITVSEASVSNQLMVRVNEIISGQYCDSIFIKYNNWDCLIDGGSGNDATTVSTCLSTYVTDHKLDMYIATHAHDDHMGIFAGETASSNVFSNGGITSFGTIVDSGSARSVDFVTAFANNVRPWMVSNGGTYIPVHAFFNSDSGYTAYQGQNVFTIDSNVSLTFLNTSNYGTPGFTSSSNYNLTSVACMLSAWNQRYFFCGDCPADSEAGIVSNYTATKSSLFTDTNDIYLKADHHGSSTSNSAAWLAWVNPDHVFISAAIVSGNSGSSGVTKEQHPYIDAVQRFEGYTYDIHWNGINGSFAYSSTNGGTPSFAGSAKQVPYYYNGSAVTGEETTTFPMSKWCLSSTYSACAKTTATGKDAKKITRAFHNYDMGFLYNSYLDTPVYDLTKGGKPAINEAGELYDSMTDSYC
jgi:beta-lactamase superfamily II metal-dependent hydrolase